jgi:hypothetical protein
LKDFEYLKNSDPVMKFIKPGPGMNCRTFFIKLIMRPQPISARALMHTPGIKSRPPE